MKLDKIYLFICHINQSNSIRRGCRKRECERNLDFIQLTNVLILMTYNRTIIVYFKVD